MKLRVQCSPDHARKLAYRMSIVGEFEVAAALEILARDVEGYTRAMTEHHALHNMPAGTLLGGECPICANALEAANA